ncbi:hypothetical protein DICSQDRAFT_34614, partial [Dichomitus squalens LYAD-421 SS1]
YDYLTTFQQELALFWRSRPTLSSILFFFNRYLAIVYYIGMAPIRIPSVCECVVIAMISVSTNGLLTTSEVFSALRAYALSNQSRALSVIIFILGSVPLILN